ncbi:hypothetical protein RLDS_24870 [Sphingobium lactosutens DS20]|uniref:Enoyl reductase (ER) domain-containing protein n=2 Tax=Sphingomonadaceae TaxID=41297 RepID=T0HBE6_9SPHN|nr:hypothetical protein L284_19645 [Novosphingobium lindaniclasticum LE124]EQB11130.1 hypothetical protein RLDS_24870 [Sphingobium lactosutens DS20]
MDRNYLLQLPYHLDLPFSEASFQLTREHLICPRDRALSDTYNRQVWLASRPTAIPHAEHFGIREVEIPNIAEGEILVRNQYLSVDPAMRGWIADPRGYLPQVKVGDTMRAFAVGEVLMSRNPDYVVGEMLMGIFGWQEYAAVAADAVLLRVKERDLPCSLALGALGLNGITAYFGLLEVGCPESGQTVAVSTAAGAVGSIVGQIANIKGCKTVGFTGGPAKVRQCLDEFGYEAAIDYKSTNDIDGAIASVAPGGVDVYFDNTSGPVSDAVMRHINIGARVVICGTAAYPSWNPWNTGPRPERHLIVKRARMQGFLATDFSDRFNEAAAQLANWIREGRLRYREDILEGLENAPGALQRLYSGQNDGKLLIRLAAAG